MAKAFSEYMNFIFQESLNVQAVQTEREKERHSSSLWAHRSKLARRGAQ
jgi:hypothetical protein